MIAAGQFKKGAVISLDGGHWIVEDYHVQKSAQRHPVLHVKLRNMKTRQVVERTFNEADKFEQPELQSRTHQYLYADGGEYVFMDRDTYEQVHVPSEVMGDTARYLAESGEAQIAMHQGEPIAVELPASVVLAIVQTDPGAKGDTRTGAMKPAKMETGAVVQVPLFVEEGERVKVDTRSGEYIERVKG